MYTRHDVLGVLVNSNIANNSIWAGKLVYFPLMMYAITSCNILQISKLSIVQKKLLNRIRISVTEQREKTEPTCRKTIFF